MKWPYIVTFLLITLLSTLSLAATPVPGLLQSFEEIVSLSKKNMQSLDKKFLGATHTIDEIQGRPFRLNPFFFQSLLLFTPSPLINLAMNNECSFWAMLDNGLLKTGSGTAHFLVVDIKISDNEWITKAITNEIILKQIYQKKCFQNQDNKKLFSENYIKNTVKNLPLRVPKNNNDCEEILYSWQRDPLTPYLCRLSKDLLNYEEFENRKKGDDLLINRDKRLEYQNASINYKKLANILDSFQRSYINNLCQSLDNKELFCKKHLSKSYWIKILNNEFPKTALFYFCPQILNKTILENKDLESCAGKLENEDHLCLFSNGLKYPALTPHPSCSSVGKALGANRIQLPFEDCPGALQNEAITNSMRHFSYLTQKKAGPYPFEETNCSEKSLKPFFKLVIDEDLRKLWNFEICYPNNLTKEKVCLPYYMGSDENDPNSEVSTVSKVVSILTGATDPKCTLLSKDQYKPMLLSFKRGCYITYDPQNCSGMACPKTVIFNGSSLDKISFNTGTLFYYFPFNIRDSEYALSKLVEIKSIGRRAVVEIRNSTEAKFHLSNSSKTIFQGMGCREDLLPDFFMKTTINQCTPLPFLITGMINDKTKDFFVVLSSIDSLNAPRLIAWNQIYSSVKNYQDRHPMNSWNLYAIIP